VHTQKVENFIDNPYRQIRTYAIKFIYMPGAPGGKVNILGDHSFGHSKKKNL
jgi:hypothetical protein